MFLGIYKKGGEEEYCIRDGTTQEQNSPFRRFFFSRILEEALLDTQLKCILNLHLICTKKVRVGHCLLL